MIIIVIINIQVEIFVEENNIFSISSVLWDAEKILVRIYPSDKFGFFVLMAYQPSSVIWFQSHPSRRIVTVLFNP